MSVSQFIREIRLQKAIKMLQEAEAKEVVIKNTNFNSYIITITTTSIIVIIFFFKDQFTSFESKEDQEKSVAFLPFKNLREENSNLYFINGVIAVSPRIA